MASILKSLRLAADPNRLRLLLLLEQEELSVAELQEILAKGQSRISTHLAQLKQAGLVDDRRAGKNAFYRLKAPAELMSLLRKAAREIPEADEDRQALRLALRQRQDKMRRYFDELAGKFGRQYVPGRSWKGDRKSTRLNSSHLGISYAVFCLQKTNTLAQHTTQPPSHTRPRFRLLPEPHH